MSSPETEYTKGSFMVAQQQNKGNKTLQQGSISVAPTDPPFICLKPAVWNAGHCCATHTPPKPRFILAGFAVSYEMSLVWIVQQVHLYQKISFPQNFCEREEFVAIYRAAWITGKGTTQMWPSNLWTSPLLLSSYFTDLRLFGANFCSSLHVEEQLLSAPKVP